MKILLFVLYNIIIITEITSFDFIDVDDTIEGNDQLTKYFQQKMIKTIHRPRYVRYAVKTIGKKDFEIGWNKFKRVNWKDYAFDGDDKYKKIFYKNIFIIIKHNVNYLNKIVIYKMGINPETDESDETFIADKCKDGHKKRSTKVKDVKFIDFKNLTLRNQFYYLDIPSKLDLRDRNIISLNPDKQVIQDCCSSYALATASAVESHFHLKNEKFIKLSAQQIIDNTCLNDYGNQGCNGGSVLQSLGYVKDVGLTSNEMYEYNGTELIRELAGETIVTRINDIVKIESEMEMKFALKHGPVVGFVNVEMMRFYRSGLLFDQNCSKETNHAVLIIGYGIEQTFKGAEAYWLILNYWGKTWGEQGFMKISKGLNQCGIGLVSYLPIINN